MEANKCECTLARGSYTGKSRFDFSVMAAERLGQRNSESHQLQREKGHNYQNGVEKNSSPGTYLRRIRTYDLRHVFATEASAAEADIRIVASLMGHSSPNMILQLWGGTQYENEARWGSRWTDRRPILD